MAPRKTDAERKAVVRAKIDKIKEKLKKVEYELLKVADINAIHKADNDAFKAKMKLKAKALRAKHTKLMKDLEHHKAHHDAIGTEHEKKFKRARKTRKPRSKPATSATGAKRGRKPKVSVNIAPPVSVPLVPVDVIEHVAPVPAGVVERKARKPRAKKERTPAQIEADRVKMAHLRSLRKKKD